jgi:hypothetical protein
MTTKHLNFIVGLLLGVVLMIAPTSAASILWVSDNGSEGFSSPTAGSSDDAFVIDLLQMAGHNVSRFNPPNSESILLSPQELEAINTNDLIILGRALGSAAFRVPQGAQWNTQVTVPLICMSPYLVRTLAGTEDRLGWFTGATLPDGGSTPLRAVNLEDPVTAYLFSGVQMTGDMTTQPYDELVDRGTSHIVEAPVSGATIRATTMVAAQEVHVIVDFPTGMAVRSGADVLSGYRMYFASGSRELENAGIENAGKENLTATGEDLFLRALEVALNNGMVPATQPRPVAFHLHPASQSILAGQDLSLSVAVTGTPPISFQWYQGDEAIPGGTHATLQILNASLEDSGSYYVIAQNELGAATSNAATVEVLEGGFGPEVRFEEDFETAQALDEWSWDGSWEIGVPTGGPGRAYNGAICAATVLAGNYAENTSGRLISPQIVVPPTTENPRLRWAHWYAFNSLDTGRVQVRVGQSDWVDLPGYPTLTGSGSGGWSEAEVDVGDYGEQSIQIGFLFTSQDNPNIFGPEVGPGWYVDAVRVITGPREFTDPEGFEEGWNGWYAEGGSWEVGMPSQGEGPTKAYSGAHYAGTVLSGNYSDGFGSVNSNFGRLVSPPFVVPPVEDNPRLRWAHLYALNSLDTGKVQVRVGPGAWVDLPGYPTLTGSGSGAWSEAEANLVAHAEQVIQIGFLFQSQDNPNIFGPEVGPGWYIDEVQLVTGPQMFPNPDGFEGGWGDWHAEGGSWEVGTPTGGGGPGLAHSGSQSMGTVLGGNYSDGFGSVGSNFGRLVSPSFVVPPARTNPRLRFWHWFDFNSLDSGEVQIKVDRDEWETLATFTSTSSQVWSRPSLDLTAFAGREVRFGFLFKSQDNPNIFGPEVGPGWYIDEVRLLHDFGLILQDEPVVRAQDSVAMPFGIAASLPVSTAGFILRAPAGHLGDVTLDMEDCWIESTITPESDSEWLVTLHNSCPTTPTGLQKIGNLHFTALAEESAFVRLVLDDLSVVNQDASTATPVHVWGSRAVVIANVPLVEGSLGPNRQRMATVYGIPGHAYEVRHSPAFDAASPWTLDSTITMPAGMSLSLPLNGPDAESPVLFLRANEP